MNSYNDYIFMPKHVKIVMKTLVNAEKPLKISEIAKRSKASERSVYYDLDYINFFLHKNGYERIDPIASEYSADEKQKEFLNRTVNESVRINEKDNRIAYLICSLIYPPEKFSVDHLSMKLDVSRNTVLNDIQDISRILKEKDLTLSYSKKTGYEVEGEEYQKRYLFLQSLNSFIKSSNYRFMDIFNEDDIQDLILGFMRIFEMVPSRIKRREAILMAYLMMIVRIHDAGRENRNDGLIRQTREYELVSEVFPDFNDHEKDTAALLVLTVTRMITFHSDNEDDIYAYGRKIADIYEKTYQVSFMDYDTLVYFLYKELLLTQYCYERDLPVPYIFTNEIIRTKGELYEQVEDIIREHHDLSFPIYENETAKTALLIASHLPFTYEQKQARIAILCNNAGDLRNFIIHEVLSVSDQIDIVGFTDDFSQLSGYTYDLLLTTKEVNDQYHDVIRIASIITEDDKERIREWLDRFFDEHNPLQKKDA